MQEFRQTVERAVRVLIALTIPIAAVLAAGIGPLVRLAFDFGPQGNELVTWVTRAYLAGIAGHSLLEIGARSFYATQEARLPLLASAINAAVFGGLALALLPALGAVGIALANTLAFTSEAVLLFVLLKPRLPGRIQIGSTLIRTLAGGVIAFLIAYGILAVFGGNSAAGAVLGMAAGFAASLPFVWKEIRLTARL
jgi:putative peptidoglycan lipid II flippase